MNNQSPENNMSQENSEKTENAFEVAKKPKIPNWVTWIVLGIVVLIAGGGIYSWQNNDINYFMNQKIFKRHLNPDPCDIRYGKIFIRNPDTGECKEFWASCDEPKGWHWTENCLSSQLNISDWQTYRNKEYGLEFKYPINWDIVSNPTSIDLVRIYGKESISNGDDVNPATVNYNLVMEVYDEDAINSLTAPHINNIKKIQISGIEASRLEYSESLPSPDNEVRFDEVIVYHNGKTFRLNLNNNVQKFNQILSTFKFLD